MPKGVALAEATVTIHRERRMVGDLVVEIETAEPAIGKVKPDILAQPSLRTDAGAFLKDYSLQIDGGSFWLTDKSRCWTSTERAGRRYRARAF
jgi:hypothetical protein